MKNAYFDKLLWVDTEFSTLTFDDFILLELAAIVTDDKFREVANIEMVIHQSEEVLEKMKEVPLKYIAEEPEPDSPTTTYDLHQKNGLLDKVRSSGTNLETAEQALIDFVNQNFGGERPILAGNSVHVDAKAIKMQMPRLAEMLHYRIVDVSSFKLVILNSGLPAYEKKKSHRAMDDIRDSINELKYLLELTQGKSD